MLLKILPYCVLALFSLSAAANATDLPKRQSGLWTFDSPDNSFVNGSLCVDDTNTNFMSTDVWSDFEHECEITRSVTDRSNGELTLTCRTATTGETKLAVTYDGDFQSRYRYAFVASFTGVDGKDERISSIVEATFQGQCPADMKPGMRTLGRSPYDHGGGRD